jgi:hypothetical protein
MTEENQNDFYRPKAGAQQSNYSVEQLERRLRLVQSIGADLKFVHAELARLGEVAEKIERVAMALRELREMERNPPAPKGDAA